MSVRRDPDWIVFLIGGHSYSGKTTAAKRIGLALGVPWMMVDDLRLAFQRACARVPRGTDALYFDKIPHVWQGQPEALSDALIAVGEVLSAPAGSSHRESCGPVCPNRDRGGWDIAVTVVPATSSRTSRSGTCSFPR
jgi:hypothetical protein